MQLKARALKIVRQPKRSHFKHPYQVTQGQILITPRAILSLLLTWYAQTSTQSCSRQDDHILRGSYELGCSSHVRLVGGHRTII